MTVYTSLSKIYQATLHHILGRLSISPVELEESDMHSGAKKMRKQAHKCMKANWEDVCVGVLYNCGMKTHVTSTPINREVWWAASSISKIQKSELSVTGALSPVLTSSYTLSTLPGMSLHPWVVTQKSLSHSRRVLSGVSSLSEGQLSCVIITVHTSLYQEHLWNHFEILMTVAV